MVCTFYIFLKLIYVATSWLSIAYGIKMIAVVICDCVSSETCIFTRKVIRLFWWFNSALCWLTWAIADGWFLQRTLIVFLSSILVKLVIITIIIYASVLRIVIFKVKVFGNWPIAKLIKQYLTVAICVNSVKLCLRVFYRSNPNFNLRLSSKEFLVIDSLILASINFLERHEIFKPLSKSNQENSKITFFEVVISVFWCSLVIGFGVLKSTHNGWLGFIKYFCIFHYIS